MSTTIRTDWERSITVERRTTKGEVRILLSVLDTVDSDLVRAALTLQQARQLADALAPGRGPRITANVAATDAALRSELMGAYGQRDRLRVLLDEAKDERDAAVARAEKAEEQWKRWEHEARERANRAEAAELRCERMAHEIECHSDVARRAQNALADVLTVPAVSRADIEKALVTGIRGTTDGGLIDQDTSIPTGECVRLAVDAVCDLLGIEAQQAEDPVEALAGQIETATRDAIRTVVDSLAAVAPGLTPPDVEGHLDQTIRDQSHTLAAHVLGQEASR